MSPAKLQNPPSTHTWGYLYIYTYMHTDRGVYTGMVKNMETTTLFRVQGPCTLNLVYMAPKERERERERERYVYIYIYTCTHTHKNLSLISSW